MLRHRIKALMFLVAMVASAFGLLLSCNGPEDEITHKGGLSNTEDLGVKCHFACDELWCYMKNFPECTSQLCVGAPDSQYCSSYCLNKNDCPEGFTCTDTCDLESSDPYCILDGDFDYLVDLLICTG